MCECCKGSHVVHSVNNYSLEFMPCPLCGPMPENERILGIISVKERIAIAKEKIRKGDKS